MARKAAAAVKQQEQAKAPAAEQGPKVRENAPQAEEQLEGPAAS